MGENILKSLFYGHLSTELIIKWLKNEEIEEHSNKLILSYECSQGEFIIFFLNYLHQETSGFLQTFSNQVTPYKIRTPRRIESFSSKSVNQSDCKKYVRRTALFPDKQSNSQNEQCLGVTAIELENKQLNNSQITSTPRQNKNRWSLDKSFPEADKECLISPIHKNKNSFSIVSKSTSFCLGDFLIQKNSSKKKNQKQLRSREIDSSSSQTNDKPNIENCLNHSNVEFSSNYSFHKYSSSEKALKTNRRRINPTNLSQDSNIFNSKRITSNETRNSFSFQKFSENEISNDEIRDSRDILREDRLKIQSKISQVSTPRQIKIQKFPIIHPSLDLVTQKILLDSLAQIYSVLFDLNLILNPLSELYFLISLILLNIENSCADQKIEELRNTLQNSLTEIKSPESFDNIFKNIHNCVYFATSVLNKQCFMLSALDRTSLKLLQENSRVKAFVPELITKLVVYHEKKLEKRSDIYLFSGGENVSFISDTDNRENFPSDSSFHTFRKQRDLFYEILCNWETNHLQPGWNFTSVLSTKIRALILMHSDPVNSMHLARLLKNQLLADCSQNFDTAPLPTCLNELANVDAEKLSKLRDRLVSKKNAGGPSPEPAFSGREEFYKEFILVCNSAKFNRHLIDCLAAEILQLDDMTFDISDENDSAIDATSKTLYLNTLKSLKTLAKFLGFLDAYPYKTDYAPNPQILSSQIALRKHFIPSIDVSSRIFEALQRAKLILTVPWTVEYLAMLDHITLRLPYFASLIENLFEIHYSFKPILAQLEKILIIKLCLGWLFERSNFPLDSYQHWISKKYQQQCLQIAVVKNYVNKKDFDDFCIDHLDLVDELVLFTCCPYLYEIQNFLSSDNSNVNNSGPTKYIRPISTVSENSDISKKRIQKHLEDSFFHNQPASTKKTIDLVSERVASVCVKFICNNLVPNAKLRSLDKFQQHLKHVFSSDKIKVQEQFTICCMKKAKELSDQCFEEFKIFSKDEIAKCTKLRCESSLNALLADDVHFVTKNTCISLAIQQSTERIEQWFSLHVNPGIFLKEFVSEMENMKHSHNSKKITYKLPSMGKNIEHDSDVKSPVTLLTNIRELMYEVHEKPENVQIENLRQIIENSFLTCQKRCDLNPVAQFTICRMFLDLYFMLATHRPDIIQDLPTIERLIMFWELYIHKTEKDSFFDRIFCPRNVAMIELSQQPTKSWQSYEFLIKTLLQKGLLKPEQFEKQTIAMFRFEWKPEMMKYFSRCVQNIVDDFVKYNGKLEIFTSILSWLANLCDDEEFF